MITARRRRTRLAAVLLAVVLASATAACSNGGDDEPPATSSVPTSSGPVASRTYVGEATTADGSYRISLTVNSTNAPPACTPPQGGGIPVTLIVSNRAETPAPFPPIRVELVNEAGREGVLLMASAGGECTFMPRAPVLNPSQAMAFTGSTPPVDAGAAPGEAGRIEVRISENDFALDAPVP